VISFTCAKGPEIRNLFGFLGTLTWFLGASAKRKGILQGIFVPKIFLVLLLEMLQIFFQKNKNLTSWC